MEVAFKHILYILYSLLINRPENSTDNAQQINVNWATIGTGGAKHRHQPRVNQKFPERGGGEGCSVHACVYVRGRGYILRSHGTFTRLTLATTQLFVQDNVDNSLLVCYCSQKIVKIDVQVNLIPGI